MLKDFLLQEINKDLNELNLQELEHIHHVLNSIKESKQGSFYYLGRLLGIDVADPDVVTMNLGMQNANTYGVAQGGAIYTLADIAIGYKILSKVKDDSQVLTVELKVNYIKPGKGRKLYAKPTILHEGKSTVVGQCAITDDEDELVAMALGTFFIKYSIKNSPLEGSLNIKMMRG